MLMSQENMDDEEGGSEAKANLTEDDSQKFLSIHSHRTLDDWGVSDLGDNIGGDLSDIEDSNSSHVEDS